MGGSTMGAGRRSVAALVAAVALLALAAAAAQAAVKPPRFSSVRVQKIAPDFPWTEPRIATGPDNTLWVVTNGDKPSESAGGGEENIAPAIVLYSTDGGNTWHKT